MNWNDLKVFLAIAESGSLAGAARDLSLNHSTAFRRLNALEADLGVRVFDRLPAGYVLTPVGERMAELARDADTAVQSIERELAGQDLEPTGTVRLTTAPNIARTIVPVAVAALRETHPGILVETLVGDSDYDLNRREADIALRATSAPPGHLVGRKVMDLCWWVCGSDAVAGPRPRSARSLAGKPLVGADRAMMRLDAMQWLESNYHDDIVARANDLSTMAALTIEGVGYSVLPSDQDERGLERLCRVPDLAGELWLLTHPDLRDVRRIRVVWDALVAAAGEA
jgi:DNA-binding transcriptional LysR family regulator